MLFMIDTCQANTMYSKFYSPNILATGSSKLDESSLSHHGDNDVGVAVIDRYTYYNLEFLETNVKNSSSKHTMKDLFDSYDIAKIHSTPGVRTDLFNRKLDEVLITDFFGNVQNVEVDGEGEEDKWEVDVEELRKLAEGMQKEGRNEGKCGVETVEELKKKKASPAEKSPRETEAKKQPPVVRRVNAMKVEEKTSLVRNTVGVAALAVCAAAWFLAPVLGK